MARLLVFLSGALLLNSINALGGEAGTDGQNCSSSAMTFENWRHWNSVTPEPVRSKAHSNNWVGDLRR